MADQDFLTLFWSCRQVSSHK